MEKQNKTKLSIIKLFFIIFVVANIVFYLNVRSKWMYEEQPYKEAKEWRIPADMMMIYCSWLVKLPFVDERSYILKPAFMLKDYFTHKWEENLPDDDAEKYMDNYFYIKVFVVPNLGSTIFYGHNVYELKEVRDMLDKTWFTIEKFATLKAKDKEFEEIRYSGFFNLSYSYVKNTMAYWLTNEYKIDYKSLNSDAKNMKRFVKLYDYIKQMDNYYKNKYPKIYATYRDELLEAKRLHQLLVWIFNYFTRIKQYEKQKNYCNPNKNIMLKEYIDTRNNLLDLKIGQSEMRQESIEKTLSDFTDENLNKTCKNLKFIKGVKNGK